VGLCPEVACLHGTCRFEGCVFILVGSLFSFNALGISEAPYSYGPVSARLAVAIYPLQHQNPGLPQANELILTHRLCPSPLSPCLASPYFRRSEILTSRFCRGPEKVAIYNSGFVPLAAKTHPNLMGSPFYVGFPEIWDLIRPVFDGAERDGVSHDVKEMPMTVERLGYPEETYFTGNFTPVRGDTGKVEGFYNAVYEITKLKIGERRREMIAAIEIPTLSDQVGCCIMVLFLSNSDFEHLLSHHHREG
jgi:hypothetical protein